MNDTAAGEIRNAMTVDVEDYFQVSAFEKYIARADWDALEPRVERNTNRILDLFAEHGVKATFFVLGWVAERYPALLRRMADEGHEIASHGYSHVRASEQSEAEFRQDVSRARKLLEDLSGTPVVGYRAASYSIGRKNLWALSVLDEEGYRYSSSIYPVRHDLYGMPEAPRFAFFPLGRGRILEVPVTTLSLGGKTFPCGGGGFFRLYPYLLSKLALAHINRRERESGIFYFHPWEIDPQQPRPGVRLDLRTRIRHYLNLSRMENRIRALLRDFAWQRMDRIFLDEKNLQHRMEHELGN